MSTTVIAALRDALTHELSTDERVFMMGEDIGIGGSFHLSLGLLEKFGAERIRDTPVSEAGFVGLAIGAAIAGMRPVVDFQYGDFLLPAADQIIQQATKMHIMSGRQVTVPLVLHAPTGASGRGAQHANSVENIFAGVPGLVVAAPSTPYDAKGCMTTALRHDGPVLIVSHKYLYGTKGRSLIDGHDVVQEVPSESYTIPIGRSATRRTGADVTIVSSLLMTHRAMTAALELESAGISAEVIDMRWLAPLDIDAVLESVSRTSRLLVVEEGPRLGGWGSAVVSAVAAQGLHYLDAPVGHLSGIDQPLPAAPHLEPLLVPTAERIRETALELVRT
ncbi:alpha-ketoacid dehydrogenase subunit beta [Microcella humidisoli]|uniref:Alpha-ketoacid dehydrogenase subunit beta n=1 Tax=Microcella humidisoli TaxID=2963406 RepID=A0ABY5G135_9MICO|nr:transketolase C-terminal domain-containing protein [Microcella humidisoli]UTT63681.1 alpha-ketoacid dehydrogenase subunit beta [Microcella humidisoli]